MKVSVAITAYNHVLFIRQAVESVLSQRTSFDYEILLGDDCSTDGTRDIIRGYAHKYPQRVRAVLREENIGGRKNFTDLYGLSCGQYFTWLDGDDYWTNPDKLQKQVDFLEARPDCCICFHSAMMIWEDGSRTPTRHFPPGRKGTYDLEDLLVNDFICTSAFLVRNKLIQGFPGWFWHAPFGDWPFLALNALQGKIGYIDECWSVYRQHEGGVYYRQPLERRIEKHIQLTRMFMEAFDAKYHPALRRTLSNRLLRLAMLHYRAGRLTEARDYGRQYIQESSRHPLMRLRSKVKLAMYMRCPALHKLISRVRHTRQDCMNAMD
jgi:glycosyltransferase involved in cell wall biosynthesis